MISIEELYEIYTANNSVTTDTRNIKNGDIFFALKGPSFDGNAFASKALELGAAYVIIDEAEYFINEKTILVNDVLNTLQHLAKQHRKKFNIPFIAITGSNGKTTSKELVYSVLNSTYKTYTTKGNLNNHIGVPLTILSIPLNAEMAIIEMGANHLNEIAGYCEYAMPNYGVITNCGKAHLEGFGSIEGVIKGKGELFEYIKKNDGTIFLMNDYDYLIKLSNSISKKITYGSSNADTVGFVLKSEPFLEVNISTNNLIINSKLVGSYNLPNILLAVCIGTYFKVPNDKIKESIENYTPSNSRSQLIEKNGNKIILDAYNANPSSMQLAIENLAKLNVENKVLILGAMAELGEESIQEHQTIIDTIDKYKWNAVALVGGDFLKTKNNYYNIENSIEASKWFAQKQFSNNYILIKGSRSSQMEKVIETQI